MFRNLSVALAATVLLAALPAATAAATPAHRDLRPIVFVHGSAGSALQYQTQAKRLASNGYPADLIEAHDYDSTTVLNRLTDEWAAIDARIDRLRARTGASQVDLLAHSLGTFVMQGYLTSDPARAARVAHYVNLDGRTATAPPGGVPTLAIWGEGPTTREVTGAKNVDLSDQAHTETVTSVESFVEVYRFFTGRDPRTTRIRPGPTVLQGRAVLFPTNVGASGVRLEIYEIHAFSGARKHHRPKAVFELSGDGSWGPFRADGRARYEFAIVREGAATHHIYFQPFLRTDRLVRLLTSLPGEGLSALMETSPNHVNLTVSRNREWWGDQPDESDVLRINGANVLNAAVSPRIKRTIGIFVYDRNVDRMTDLAQPIAPFFAQPFITGIDVYVPARHTVFLTATQRGTGEFDLLNVPAWPSPDHRVSVQFNDYSQ
jgi:pimeloyl-ACP methyl ester carboxylesterase